MSEFPVRPSEVEKPEIMPSRWQLIRDVAAFQLKLFLDGLRDLLFMPISLGIAILDLLHVGPRAGRQFYDFLRVGRGTEEWIDLFGAARQVEALPGGSSQGLDRLVGKLETLIVQEYERGGITASAKDAVDRALDGIAKKEPSGPLSD